MPVVFSLLGKVNPKLIIIAIILIAVGREYLSLTGEISDLETTVTNKNLKISELEKDKTGLKFERDGFESALDSVNKEIERLAVNEEKALSELEEWKSKPPEIKHKPIYENIPQKVEVYKKGDCKDGLELNRAISEMNYGDL